MDKGILHQWLKREHEEMAYVKAFRDRGQQSHTWNELSGRMNLDHTWMDDFNTPTARKYSWEMLDQVCEDTKAGPDEVIALGYSIPKSWPPNLQTACKRWFQDCGADLYYKEPNPHKLRHWYLKRPRLGLGDQELTRENLQERMFRHTKNLLTEMEAYFVADQILTALENGTMFESEPEKEQEAMRGLYEVFIVNINDTDDIDVTQVVADSDDKAKMKAWADIEVAPDALSPPDVDDYDFFTVKIGGVRDGCCKGDSCKT